MNPAPEFSLHRDAFGKLILTNGEGSSCEATPVRAFPIGAPGEGIALVDAQGHELAWIDALAGLPASQRELVEEELASRDFMPIVERIVSVSGFSTPCAWTVVTDRGETTLFLKGEENIRRLAESALLIVDGQGVQYLVRDRRALDARSRGFLDRFL